METASSRRDFLAAAVATQVPSPRPSLRAFGKTGWKVSSLGFGCMTTSDAAVIERAADLGINYFDTARAYQNGNNERMVGAALKAKRKQVIISSKSLGKTRQEALADLDTSLRELNTDYLDIWYLHSKSTPEELTDDLLEAQRSAKKAGKIRFAGVTTHFNMQDMLPHLLKRGQTDVALVAYNFTMRPEVTSAIQTARKAGMGVVAMKVLAGGYSRIQRGDRLYGKNPEALTGTLKQEGAMLAALKWALKNESVDTAIVCMTDFDQLDENYRAMTERYTPRDEKLLSAQLSAIAPVYCRMCGACSGVCDKGVPVSDMLRVLSYADGYREFALARERYLELPAEARRPRCGDCPSCSVECPNGVQVRRQLMRAQELLA
ncbi:MAG: aldo/keto reductase [Acidobacteria bacterium]|nr:aldo/keto reductase [Acidobacteriota bacterium]